MRAPDFWHIKGTLTSRLLGPLGRLYAGAGRWRARTTKPLKLPVPVICIGNIIAGGAGKTPVSVAVARQCRALGFTPHFLTRGYGGKLAGPVRVDPLRHSAGEVGDEALLLAATAPTWVSRRRPPGAQAAVADGADVIIMDDGHQNPSLVKDLSLIVVDGAYGFGNGRVIPAGPLREPVEEGLARADGVVILGPDTANIANIAAPLTILRGRLAPGPEAMALAGRKVVAFAGIGRPDKFFETLRAISADVAATHPFPDHHAYQRGEIETIIAQAVGLRALAVTTSKDAVRLPADLRRQVAVLTITVDWDNPAGLDRLLRSVLPEKGGRP